MTGIGERHDQIDVRLVLLCQTMAEALPAEIHVLAEDLAVRPGEVDQLEDTVGVFDSRKGGKAADAGIIDDHDFARLELN